MLSFTPEIKSASQKIKLDELQSWFSEKIEFIIENFKKQTNIIFNEIKKEQDELKKIKTKIEKLKVKGKGIIEEKKDEYSYEIERFLDSSEVFPKMKYNEIREYYRKYIEAEETFWESTSKIIYSLNEFMKKQIELVNKKIKSLNLKIKKIKELTDGERGVNKIKEINEHIEIIKEAAEHAKLKKEELAKQHKRDDGLEYFKKGLEIKIKAIKNRIGIKENSRIDDEAEKVKQKLKELKQLNEKKSTPARKEKIEQLEILKIKFSDKNIEYLELKDTEYRMNHYEDKIKEIKKEKERINREIRNLSLPKLKQELEKEILQITNQRIDLVLEE